MISFRIFSTVSIPKTNVLGNRKIIRLFSFFRLVLIFCPIFNSFFKSLFIFIFGCTGSLLLHVGFPQLWSARATLQLRCINSSFHGVSCCGAEPLGHAVFSSCGTWALLLHSMCNPLDQGSNPCLLHWQAGSLPLNHQGSPFLPCVLPKHLEIQNEVTGKNTL